MKPFIAFVMAFYLFVSAIMADIYYVDVNGAGGAGSSWATAFTDLQDALAVAADGDEIWVAEGEYFPTSGTDRTATFQLLSGVKLIGGFTNGMESADNRNWTNYPALLSGDIGTPGDHTDNSYQIITGAEGAVIDGFIVVYGYANGASPRNTGGGLYMTSLSMDVLNCIFRDHYAASGAGIFASSSSPTIKNSSFLRNTGTGGGIRFSFASTALVDNCSFLGNAGDGGGVYTYGADCSPVITNCVFVTNTVSRFGAAIHNNGSTPLIVGCDIINNTATAGNSRCGGIYNTDANAVIRDSRFSYNSTLYGGGAVVLNELGSAVVFDNCRFIENYHRDISSDSGSVVLVTNTLFTSRFTSGIGVSAQIDVRNCIFAGSVAGSGGGMGIAAGATATVVNCVFSGCYAIAGNGKGGGIDNSGRLTVDNCTFSGTRSLYSGYDGIYQRTAGAVAMVTNTIFWGNQAYQEIYNVAGTTSVVGHICYEGSITGGTQLEGDGILTVAPLFADSIAGTWTADGVYDEEVGVTVFTDSNTNWVPGELSGKFVNPNIWQVRRLLIVTNDATTLTAWGCGTEGRVLSTAPYVQIATNEASYVVYDYHLKSKYGRYTALGRMRDGTNSPCIDAGDPDSDWSSEADYSGRRVNMGAYGNTRESSKSLAAGMFFMSN